MDPGLPLKPTVFLVEECANPSTDFFILPMLVQGDYRIVRCGHHDLPSSASLTDTIVIFVRYVPPIWAELIKANRKQLRALIFFMDDDVLDFSASFGMPISYRYKLTKLALRQRNWLRKQQAKLWVSTPYLVEKYAEWQAQLLLPSPIPLPEQSRRIFYHGSIATHKAEIRWLRPVIERVLAQDPQAVFEIIGKKEVFELYRDLSRVTVVQTLKWPAYQAFLAMPGRHIGLNPLLDIPFNRARSYTKFFDITRTGAVGIYSPDCNCTSVVNHAQNGLVVDLDPDAWVDAILSLTQNEPYRQALLHNAEATVQSLHVAAQNNYQSLLASNSKAKHDH